MNKCRFCENDKGNEKISDCGGTFELSKTNDVCWTIEIVDWHDPDEFLGDLNVKYCPMCGRNLFSEEGEL